VSIDLRIEAVQTRRKLARSLGRRGSRAEVRGILERGRDLLGGSDASAASRAELDRVERALARL
jgi:hypothetical protein